MTLLRRVCAGGFVMLAAALSPRAASSSTATSTTTSTSTSSLDLSGIEDFNELDLEALLGTVFAVSRVEESIVRAPATVTILDRARIQLSGARSLPELLRRVPGVHVMTTVQGSWVVSLRGSGGLQSNNVVVLLDGHPMNSILDASVDWTAIPVDIREIERIEIVRGPVSTIYGANAYTGVVAIITDARGQKTSGVAGALRAGYGEGPLGSAFASLRGALGGLRYKVSAAASARPMDAEVRDRKPDLERVAGHVHLERDLGASSRAELTLAVTRTDRASLDHLVVTPHELRSDVGLAGLRLELGDLPGVLESIHFWGRGNWLSTGSREARAQAFSYAGVDALAGTLGVDLRLLFSEDLSLQMGVEAGGAQVDSPFLHPAENDRFRQTYGVHANAHATVLDSVALAFGARGDVSAMTPEPQLSLRASATYFTSAFSLRVSAGTAYRQPTMIEVGSRLVDPQSGLILLEGNAELGVPRLDSIELGAMFAASSEVTVTPTIFVERLRSLMVTDFEPIVRKTFRNDAEDRTIAGAELEMDWRITPWLTSSYSVAALRELSGETPTGATVGVEENNPILTASGGLRGQVLDDRLGFGADVAFVSSRAYNVRTGIPPRLISEDLAAFVQVTAAVEYRLLTDQPLWSALKVDTRLPSVESPFPEVRRRATEAVLSIEWRAE